MAKNPLTRNMLVIIDRLNWFQIFQIYIVSYISHSKLLSIKIPWLSFSYALSNCIFPEIFKGIHTMYFLVCTFYGQCILLHFYHKDNKFEFRNHTVWRKSRASHAINKFLEGCYIKLFVVKNVLFFFNPLFLFYGGNKFEIDQ